MWRIAFCISLSFQVVPWRGVAAEVYAGKWQMTTMTLGVKVESWGEYCGPRPVSYTSKTVRAVDIRARDKHLIFSTGGLRTDRCGSPNPKLRKISMKAQAGSWKMVCETERSDPKYERGVYTLVAQGDNKLEYKAESKFDWTLKGDHCVAISKERRVFVRVEEKPEQMRSKSPTPAAQVPEPSVSKPESLVEEVPIAMQPAGKPRRKLDDIEPWCDKPGPAKKIIVQPAKHRLGPGESVCFKAVAVDEEGCRTPTGATWTATQNDRVVHGLLKPNGCFRAGDTAADSEGTYIVTAQVGQKSAAAEVSVVFPDLGELFAARLRPLQDIEKDGEERAPAAAQGTDSENTSPKKVSQVGLLQPVDGGVAVGGSETDEESASVAFWVIALLLGAAFVGFAVVIFLGMKRRSSRKEAGEDSPEGRKPPTRGSGGGDRASSPRSGERSEKGEERRRCPKCNSEFASAARFCPHDGSALELIREQGKNELGTTGSRVSAGMVCPKCHRGYEAEARFCPHDSSRLVPYDDWRKNRTGRQQKI